MYDYVRRQQELQSNMFSSKTFQWMDHSNSANSSWREPGWVKVYAKDLPTDPLAYSSSSLFTAPRATPNAFQRTAANLSPHRSLFTFRRQRQNSDAATRPPSGISSAFQQRRRGFTAPPGSQPSFDGVAAASYGAHQLSSSSRRDAPTTHKALVDPHPKPVGQSGTPPLPPIDMPQIASATQRSEDASGSMSSAAFVHIPFAGSSSKAAHLSEDYVKDPSFSSCLFPALGHLSHPPQLHSSFSPPHSPHPRTICAKARSLMHRVRHLKPGSLSHPSDRAPQPVARQGGPNTGGGIAHSSAQIQHAGPLYNAKPRATRSRGSARRAQSRRPPPPPSSELGGAPKARALPRSPLANPMVITDTDATERFEVVPDKPTSRQSDSASSDEDILKCELCHRYKGADWIVHCNAGHMMCFGCIQAHVKALLADKPAADVVFCRCGGCQSYITSKFLRQCLSPQRFKQIVDNCVQGYQARQTAKRSVSLATNGGDRAEEGALRSLGLANLSEEGFDEPVIVTDTGARSGSPEVPAHCALPSRSVVTDIHGLAQAVNGLSVGDHAPTGEQLYSASMPALPRRHNQPTEPRQPDVPAVFVSELTSLERVSMNSIVFAASVAANSSLTLSPESVGSRLRRVPKAQENVRLSPGSHSTDAFEESPISLSQTPVFPHNDSQAGWQQQQQPTSALYDYADMDLDTYMRTPRPPQIPLFASAASPMSWSPQQLPAQQILQPKHASVRAPPPLPPSLPAHFRASATWITPEQRYSGYTENILLNATLFETIRRRSSPVDSCESDQHSLTDSPLIPRTPAAPRPPVPNMAEVKSSLPADDDTGVYIPTWRRTEDARAQYQMPLWAGSEFGSQSGVLCEAAELNFDLYETLHRRH
ncbi:hypothetical protein GGI08_004887 [Coemansia sp. S2]|nr:hypothetical protein H4S03_001574 [Coemansia sp. S3946]KAJ2053068.1 hypothetical protein GGI08_004887 [Coemansia sp. S2]